VTTLVIATTFATRHPSSRGGTEPRSPATTTTTPASTTTTRPPTEVVIAAVGDAVCAPGMPMTFETCRQQAVSEQILANPRVELFLALGDLQYESGDLAAFEAAYAPSYGRLKAITKPMPGNHEYRVPGASGYFAYFGAAAGVPGQGWYSFDVGNTWHVVVLNGTCDEVSCARGSAQERWLRADLAANQRPCVLGAWHQPRFSSGTENGSDPSVAPFWDALADHRAEIALAGHEHNYERFDPQLPDGTPSAHGIREFVVGTGGRSIYRFRRGVPPERNSAARLQTFGYLELTLDDGTYAWRFVNEAGFTLDEGTGACH
jgi:hypothetical protein